MAEINQKLIEKGYKAVIGLEVHVQLNTASKIFSSDPNTSDPEPNKNISVISLGHPGTLPVLNEAVVEKAVFMGLACDCQITRENHFARKSYFYPDLPKGYQTTQDKTPICTGGSVELFGKGFSQSNVPLHHIHLEEDAGKSIHDEGPSTLIDLNRAGAPLIEIVTEPAINGPDEAAAFLQEIRRIVRYLGISEANMEKGEFRCDANISIMPLVAKKLGNKVEVKNMNSFNHVRRAISFELQRQLDRTLKGENIKVETRAFNPESGTTSGMRFKETMNDYRYFPCPDLPPVIIEQSFLNELKDKMKETPAMLRHIFSIQYQLSDYDVSLLTEERETALYFQSLCEWIKDKKGAANWVNGPIRNLMNESGKSISQLYISVEQLAELINLVNEGKLNTNVASRQLLPLMMDSDLSALALSKAHDLLSVDDGDELETLVEEVLLSLPDEVSAFKKGKKKLMGLFMGEIMKKSSRKAAPRQVQQILNKKLK